MLPVIVYEPDAQTRAVLTDTLAVCAKERGDNIRLLIQTASAKEAARFLQDETGILLLLSGVEPTAHDERKLGIQLGWRAMRQNRDNYTVFCLRDADDLEILVNLCARPAGVLCIPVSEKKAASVFRRILEDHAQLNDDGDDGDQLILQVGGVVHRMPSREVLYIEARDKKVCVWTQRQCLSVYERLSELEGQLRDRFVRCHRSYLVNYLAIERVDYVEMQLYIKGGTALPISRSCRDALKDRLNAGKKVSYAN